MSFQDNHYPPPPSFQAVPKSIDGSNRPSMRPSNGISYSDANSGLTDHDSLAMEDKAPSLSYRPPSQPINDAVTSAFHQAHSTMPPNLIHLITQNVIKELQNHTVATPNSAQPVQPPSAFPVDSSDKASSVQESPMIDRTTVYTPPSPQRSSEQVAISPRLPNMSADAGLNIHGYQTSRRDTLSPISRASNEDAVLSDSDTRSTRPDGLRRKSTDPDASVLEKHWGRLFDDTGEPTEKLTSLLRGIANHLIEEVEPKHSLVVTPDKMQRFYEDTRLDERRELYPWKLIFDDKTSSISRLLRDPDVRVQHHLVQPSPDARPDIPGLTPLGFATWLTLLMRAHPDHEYERLTKILRTVGVNHPDERKQRFPAAVPRKLFPRCGDQAVVDRLAELMATHCKVQVTSRHNSTATAPDTPLVPQPRLSPRKSEAPPPPTVEEVIDDGELLSAQLPSSKRASFVSSAEAPFKNATAETGTSKAPSVTSIEDEPTPQPPIERERKPYFAQPGLGKSYEIVSSGDEKPERNEADDANGLRRTKSVNTSQKARMRPPSISIHQRPERSSITQQDGGDPSRPRPSQPASEAYDGAAMSRARSNSAYGQPPAFRRSRSNSTYDNATSPREKRYHTKRSPSLGKTGYDSQFPRVTAPDLSYPPYTTTSSSSHPPRDSYRPSVADGYEYTTRNTGYDPRGDPRMDRRTAMEREKSRDRDFESVGRSSRPRGLSNAAANERPYFTDAYRQQAYPTTTTSYSANVPYQYPPSAYRDGQ